MAPQGLRSSNSLQLLGGVLSFNRRENLVFHMDFVIYLTGGGGGGMLRDFFSMKSTKSNQM